MRASFFAQRLQAECGKIWLFLRCSKMRRQTTRHLGLAEQPILSAVRLFVLGTVKTNNQPAPVRRGIQHKDCTMTHPQPSLRAIAKSLGVHASTVMRWKRDKPELYRLAVENYREKEERK